MSWNTHTLRVALRAKFDPKEYALLEEVRNSTGYIRSERYADALVMGLWPSRGLTLLGIEIKQSRTDWVKELKEPAKADAFARYCDQWALLVADPKIIHEGELPPNWGLLAPAKSEWSEDGKLKWVKEPNPLQPVPIDRPFLAALCRTLAREEDAWMKHRLEARLTAGITEACARLNAEHAQKLERLEGRLKILTDNVRTFEAGTGLRVGDGYRNQDLGRQLQQLGKLAAVKGLQDQLEHLARQAGVIARAAREHQRELNEEPDEWSI